MKYDVFCNVIDNYGDAGVCLRLCRELVKQDNEVQLFCNHLPTLQKILNRLAKRSLAASISDLSMAETAL